MGPPVPGIRSAPQGPHVGAGPDRSFSTFAPKQPTSPTQARQCPQQSSRDRFYCTLRRHRECQGPGFRLRSSDLSVCSLITPAFRCTGPLLQPPDNSSPLGALRLHRRDGGELLRCPLGSNDQTLDHSPGLQPYPGLNHRLEQVSESTRGRSPPGALPRRTRSGAGAHGLSGPSSTCAAMRRGLHTIPPRASHCPLLPRDGAAVFRWSRPLLGTPAGQLRHPTGRDFSRGHGRPLLSHRLIRPRRGPRTFTSRRLLPSPAGPATAQREAADAVVHPGLSSPEPSRRPISAPGSLRRHQRGTLSPSPLL
ncbi:hypothetical protein NDU88_004515 [Pleurodeles waltl]|uniref:Uncharacterized protein n=1 Tax=Pleurodeles waltl TaxID=8319 RepID=A0AAV7WW48_PLEWA|nr:hypothetical protein NDU88_004515 [Pleurodeles waltl]